MSEDESDPRTLVIQDSLVNILPTWQALKVKVAKDKTSIDVIVGDATFCNATPEVKAQKAQQLGKMLLRIYSPDSHFEQGNLIVTKDIHNTSFTPKDGVSTAIPFAELKK